MQFSRCRVGVAWTGGDRGDGEKEIDLRGFEVKLTRLDDGLE